MLANIIYTTIIAVALSIPLIMILKSIYFEYLEQKDEREYRLRMHRIKEEQEYERK